MRLASALLPLLLLLPATSRAEGSFAPAECGLVQDWIQARDESLAGADSIAGRMRLAQVEEESREIAATAVFHAYMEGRLPKGFLETCGGTPASQELFRQSLSQAFFDGSLAALENSGVEPLMRLARLANAEAARNGVFSFKALSHLEVKDVDLGDRKAGFHRGRQSLFMVFDEIPPGEWLFVFTHELTHRLDPLLDKAISAYGKKSQHDHAFTLQAQLNLGKAATDEDLASLHSLLHAGLDRGLLAEYRSWVFCFSVYRAGIMKGLWSPIDRFERIFDLQKPGEALSPFVFRFLDPRFTDPAPIGLYKLPIVRSVLEAIRSELRGSSSPPPLGLLGDYALTPPSAPAR